MTLVEKTVPDALDRDRTPSFVDLRAFAAVAEPSLRNGARDGGDFASNRLALPVAGEDGPVSALFLRAGSSGEATTPHDDFIIVLKGSLSLTGGGVHYHLEADDAAVVPHGTSLTWRADDDVLAVSLRYGQSKAAGRPITPISRDPALEPSAKPAADVLLGPAPDCRNFNDYRVDEGKFVCGTWDSTAYQRKGFLYGHHEIMLISQGSVTLTDQDGRSQTFAEDSLVLVEAGSQTAWDSREHVTKVFAIYRL